MFALAIPALLCLQHVYAAPAPQSSYPQSYPQYQTAAHVLNLKKIGLQSPSSKNLQAGLELVKTSPLKSVEGGAGYGISANLGGQTFEVIFDTGSSDLWVFQDGVKCIDQLGIPEPAKSCGFGKEFSGSFDEGKISGENFFAQYGSGEELIGTVGYEKVTVGGLTVSKQEIGLVDEAYWQGDGSVSGIFGFARSSITSAYKGSNPAKDSPANHVTYSSFIDSAISGGLSPVFSVVLERKGGSSQVALGGLPTVSFDHSFATTPITKVKLQSGQSAYAYYTIETEGLVVGGKTLPAFEAVVDTGTTLLYLPTSVAAAVNKAFDPPSKTEQGIYVNSCTAKAPTLAVKIGGKSFTINPADLLISEPGAGGLCISGVQATSAGEPSILGDVFLHNVVAVFDIGKEQMQFAPHVNY